ncbi:MAG: DUF3187 family protein [Gammaproteobacteria bacterium]|nr:DUF3187 family protein [Gammaproteobacteria bacterium]
MQILANWREIVSTSDTLDCMDGIKPFQLFIMVITFIVISTHVLAESSIGLPTRSQNPLLQGYFLPVTPHIGSTGWSYSHALYITNTYQVEQTGAEQAIVDVENTRYDLQANYTQELWHFNINASLIDNSSGFMDQTIERWHDFFGLPQAGRDKAVNNQLKLYYAKDGVVLVDSETADNGISDLQLGIGYQLKDNLQLWIAAEIPLGTSYDFISNDGIDLAGWLSLNSSINEKSHLYGTAGLAIPHQGGLLKNQLNDQYAFGQFGWRYILNPDIQFLIQGDYHSPIIKKSNLDIFDHSFQAQFALRLPNLLDGLQLDIFFSEDLFPGHAPDITFSIRIATVAF